LLGILINQNLWEFCDKENDLKRLRFESEGIVPDVESYFY
jgi:hypothetical protein